MSKRPVGFGAVFAAAVLAASTVHAADVEVENRHECNDELEHGWTATDGAPVTTISHQGVLPLPLSLDLGNRAEAALPFVTVDVTAADGTSVPGRVESLDPTGTHVLWRPTAKLTAGVRHGVRMYADNEAMSEETRFWGPTGAVELSWTFVAADEPPTIVEWDSVQLDAHYFVVEEIRGESDIVCCDEGFPLFDTKSRCIEVRGTCGSRSATGRVRSSVQFVEAPAVAAANTVFDIGDWSDASGVACATVTRIDLTDLSRDEVEFCMGLEGPVGPLENYDVAKRLASVCDTEPYTCERGGTADWGYAWNLDDCSGLDSATTDVDAPSRGCGCAATASRQTGMLGWLLLVLFGRRRSAACA